MNKYEQLQEDCRQLLAHLVVLQQYLRRNRQLMNVAAIRPDEYHYLLQLDHSMRILQQHMQREIQRLSQLMIWQSEN